MARPRTKPIGFISSWKKWDLKVGYTAKLKACRVIRGGSDIFLVSLYGHSIVVRTDHNYQATTTTYTDVSTMYCNGYTNTAGYTIAHDTNFTTLNSHETVGSTAWSYEIPIVNFRQGIRQAKKDLVKRCISDAKDGLYWKANARMPISTTFSA